MRRAFILDPDATHTQASLYEWLRRREDVLILAYLAHGCGGGAAGTDQGGKVWAGGEAASYPLDWKSLLSVDGGGYELYHRGALLEMNIIRRSDDDPHDNLTKTVGLGLADAYAESVARTQYVRHYLDATRLRKADIEDFAQHGCLCQVRHHDEERRRLIDALFRFDTPDVYAVKRLASLCFFLDIVAQSDDQPLYQDAFRSVLYFWSFGGQHAYQPMGNLLSPVQRWRIFQLRQYFVFAVESFWSLFLHRVGIEALSGEEYLAWLLSELDLRELANNLDITLPVTDARRLTLQAFYEAVRAALPPGAFESGPAALRTRLNEQALTLQIRHERSDLNVQVRAGRALLMLALIYWRCQLWHNGSGWIYASDRYAAGRLPIERYLRHVERAFREDWTLARWLGWFHHRYLWLQHRRITLEKLISRRRETAKFELVDDAPPGATSNGSQGSVPRFRGTGTDSPKMNAPRFPSALSILTDLDLIEPVQTGGYRLRPDGAALLERFRTYTVPEWTEPEDDETADNTEAATSG
ncbi:MAG: hypothetical protein H8E35_12965 [Ardenticatenia bacterium]|nr:hypothetical protein [Ardenticatenia bacterium]